MGFRKNLSNASTSEILNLITDDGYLFNVNHVWNPSALAWEKMEQPVLEATNSNFYIKIDGLEDLLTEIKVNQTNTTQQVKITDGTDIADVISADSYKGLVTVNPSHISTLNSSTTPLAGGATFTGVAEDLTNYSDVLVAVKASHASAADGLKIQFSIDGTNWDVEDAYTIPAGVGKTFSAQICGKYFRIVYTNGSTLQTYFRLQVIAKANYSKPSSHRIADIVSAQDDAELVKSQIIAQKPNGDMVNINSTTGGNLKISLEEVESGVTLTTATSNEYLDAFTNVPVAQPQTLFDAQFTYSLQPLLYEQVTSGTGASITHDATNRCATMAFSSTTGSAYMQSYEYMRYQPGKGQRVFITFNMNGGIANVQKFARYGDANENYQFVLDGTTPKVQINTQGATGQQTASQANWNIDPLNGNGRSGITINFEKEQILVIDFQALYVGRVRFGFDINGMVYWVHYFNNANNTTKPYIKTANLPIACGMTSSASATTTMDFNCCSVISYGGVDATVGYGFSVEGTGTAGNNARAHILSIRPKTTFNSITNRTQIIIDNIDLIVTGNTAIKWELVLGQAISGATTFADVNTAYSTVEFNTAGTISGDPAIVLASGYVTATAATKGSVSQNIVKRYPLTLDVAGNQRSLGTLSVIATGLGATSACRASLTWKEVR